MTTATGMGKNRAVVFVVTIVVSTGLSGCFNLVSMPKSVPETPTPNFPADTFLEINARTEVENYTARVSDGEVCHKGDCSKFYKNVRRQADVAVTEVSANGRPVSIGEVAVAASPDFVADTAKLRDLRGSCKRGKVITAFGAAGLVAAYILLQYGFSDNGTTALKAGGIGAGVGGLALVGGGLLVFGGQHCDAAAALYKRWSPVYKDVDAVQVRGDSARMFEQLAEKFNADHQRARAAAPVEPSEADASE